MDQLSGTGQVAKGHRYGVTPVVRQFCQNRGVELVELGTDLGDAEIFVRMAIDPEQAAWFSDMLGCGESEDLQACRFDPTELPFVVVPNRDAQLKQAIEDDDADRRMAASALRLARLFTNEIDEGAPVRIYLNMSSPMIQALSEAHRSGHKSADQAARSLRSVKAFMSAGVDGAFQSDFRESLTDLANFITEAVS